jgi:hypothetical protein
VIAGPSVFGKEEKLYWYLCVYVKKEHLGEFLKVALEEQEDRIV